MNERDISDVVFDIAKAFHGTYERLSPSFDVSAAPWDQVPDNNRRLMMMVVSTLLSEGVISEGVRPQRAGGSTKDDGRLTKAIDLAFNLSRVLLGDVPVDEAIDAHEKSEGNEGGLTIPDVAAALVAEEEVTKSVMTDRRTRPRDRRWGPRRDPSRVGRGRRRSKERRADHERRNRNAIIKQAKSAKAEIPAKEKGNNETEIRNR